MVSKRALTQKGLKTAIKKDFNIQLFESFFKPWRDGGGKNGFNVAF